MREYNESDFNPVAEEMGSNYVTINPAWDNNEQYNVSFIKIDLELKMIDSQAIMSSLSQAEDGTILVAGDRITFKKDVNTYKPFVKNFMLSMKYRYAIAAYLLKHNPVSVENGKDWTTYKIVYKNTPFVIGMLNEGASCFFNIAKEEDNIEAYYRKQKELRTRTKSLDFELEIEHPVYGDQITGFPMKLDDLSDELDDMVDKICRMKSIPELQYKIDELKKLLDM